MKASVRVLFVQSADDVLIHLLLNKLINKLVFKQYFLIFDQTLTRTINQMDRSEPKRLECVDIILIFG